MSPSRAPGPRLDKRGASLRLGVLGPLAVAVSLVAGCASSRPVERRQPVVQPVFVGPHPLVIPGAVLLHQVAIDFPGGARVLVGRLAFTAEDRFRLVGQTEFGLRLFSLGYDGHELWADLAPPLRGKFRARQLARYIAEIYLGGCAASEAKKATGTAGFRRSCRRPDGIAVDERIAADRTTILQRVIRQPHGRTIEIRYSDYRNDGGHHHPHRIELRSGPVRVTIVTVKVSEVEAS